MYIGLIGDICICIYTYMFIFGGDRCVCTFGLIGNICVCIYTYMCMCIWGYVYMIAKYVIINNGMKK